MERTKIGIIAVVLGSLIALFTGIGLVLILGLVIVWLARKDLTLEHKRCANFSLILFISLFIFSLGLILYSPASKESVYLANFIYYYGLTLVLAVLPYGLLTVFGKYVVGVSIFSSSLGYGTLLIESPLARPCVFLAQIAVFVVYFIAYKNVDVLKAQLTKPKE